MAGVIMHMALVRYLERGGRWPYPQAKKLDEYLYAKNYVSYNGPEGIDMDADAPGGCSSFHVGNFVGRNFDWYYDERATFILRCSMPGKHRSIGVASCSALTNQIAASGHFVPSYDALPWYTLDGINDAGVYASINVVPNDIAGGITDAIPTEEQLVTLDGRQVVRYILDNFATADEAYEQLHKHAKITANHSLSTMKYTLHAMVADVSGTCFVMEIINGSLKRVESDISTNFWVYGTTCATERNSTVYTNADSPEHKATELNGITPMGSGLERWNLIASHLSSGGNDHRAMLNRILYTHAYDRDVDNVWCSEFVGSYGDGAVITVDTPSDTELMGYVLDGSLELFKHRVRGDHNTWQTLHSSLYNLSDLTLNLVSQEKTANEFNFSLN